jgi:hypothetical protein
MTKQDAIRLITTAQSIDELREVLLAMVEKLPWEITLPSGIRTIEPPARI